MTREQPMKSVWILAGVMLGTAAFAAASSAASSGNPSVVIAGQLGVGLDELVACTNTARDHATAAKGSDARKAEMQGLVLACLQEDHPSLTAADFTTAIQDGRTAP